METKQQNKSLTIVTIVAMMFLYAMISFVTNLAAPVGKIWGASFEDPAQAERMGMLGNLFNFLAYLIMGIPAGNILAKRGYKSTALAAISLGFIGIGFQWMSGVLDSFAVYLVGALFGGFCVCIAYVNGILATEVNEATAPFTSRPCIGLAPGPNGLPPIRPHGVLPVFLPYTTFEVMVRTD